MKLSGNVMQYEDFKYVIQDVGNLYLGSGFSYEELLVHEMVPFKLKAIISQYILKEASSETTLESQFYYLEENTFLYEVFGQLKARIKVQIQVEKKGILGGRNKVGYKEKILSLQELAGMNLAKKKGAGILVREIIFSKFGIMTFNI
ncbi:hypothetical protein D7V94_05825 [Parablautia intestinalis]|uniref:Uncharacterized protein n=2 Tax=Parablautia intestinalis TaxID=2320100 RepID=A0A3A9AZ59_9FIRM|nr:hypothetical protein [Lachnospiraceae bacterium]RKI92833.1 hypothetical protein D7V94_05825 [Parablautia intestinalis]